MTNKDSLFSKFNESHAMSMFNIDISDVLLNTHTSFWKKEYKKIL